MPVVARLGVERRERRAGGVALEPARVARPKLRQRRPRARMLAVHLLRLAEEPETVLLDVALLEGEGGELLGRVGGVLVVEGVDAGVERGAQLLEVGRSLRLLPHERSAAALFTASGEEVESGGNRADEENGNAGDDQAAVTAAHSGGGVAKTVSDVECGGHAAAVRAPAWP